MFERRVIDMTIDEAIANAREKAKEIRENIIDGDNLEPYESYCITMADKSAEEHEQFAEWLEELKELRNMTAGHLYAVAFNRGYLKAKKEVRDKAIDDFVENISLKISESIIWGMLVNSHKDNSFNDTSDKIVDYVINTANEIAEQLKAGEKE